MPTTTAKPDYERAKKKAEELLANFKIEEPIVPVFEIAKTLGLEVKIVRMPEKLLSVSGFIDIPHKIIYVNSDDSPARRLFTVAHELGHYLLNHKPGEIEVLLRLTTVETTPIEKEANCFAANLLVPEKKLLNVMNTYHLTRKESEILAKLFGVSNEVIINRLHHLSWKR